MSSLALNGATPLRTEPFPSWPVWDEGELQAAERVIRSGVWGGKGGPEGKAFVQEFADFHGAKFGIGANSGTSALEIALSALGAGPGDEVILPAYTFIATANAILNVGAIPIFADIERDTFTLSAESAAQVITDKTVGIVPVHMGGCPADMDALLKLSGDRGLFLLEDAAQAWGAEWSGEGVGHLGDAGIFSFQSSKNITAGEGGMVLTDSEDISDLLFARANAGRMPKIGGWELHEVGGNSRLAEILAAMLRVQLERYPAMLDHRIRSADRLTDAISGFEGVRPLVPSDQVTRHAYHLYMWRFVAEAWGGVTRAQFMDAMRAEGIPVYPGYTVPLYKHPLYTEHRMHHRHPACWIDYKSVKHPNTEAVCDGEGLWLGQEIMLAEDADIDQIVLAVSKVWDARDQLL